MNATVHPVARISGINNKLGLITVKYTLDMCRFLEFLTQKGALTF